MGLTPRSVLHDTSNKPGPTGRFFGRVGANADEPEILDAGEDQRLGSIIHGSRSSKQRARERERQRDLARYFARPFKTDCVY